MLKFDEKRWRATPCLEGGVPYYLLVEERLGHRIRLFEIEYKLLLYFDGSRSLHEICSAFRSDFQISIGTPQAESFVRRLLQRELLSGIDESPLVQDDAASASSSRSIRDKLAPLLPFVIGGILAAAGLEFYKTFTTYSVAVLPVTEMSIPRFSPVRARSDLPMRSGRLSFAVSGLVEEMAVEPGDRVTAGEVMARLRLSPSSAKRLRDIRGTEQSYKEMAGRLGAELGEARRFIEQVRERIDGLKESALGDPTQGNDNPALQQLAEEQALLLEREQSFASLESAFEEMLGNLKSIKRAREDLLTANRARFILAPFDAVVDQVSCKEGQRIRADEPCFSVVDQRNRIVEFRLREKPEQYVGARVQLLKGGRWISGTLDEITQVYQQFLVRVRYKDEIRSESASNEESARLLERWIDDAAAIPRSAMWDSSRSETVGYVLLLRGEDEAEVKLVDVVKRDSRWVWIRVGELAGEGEEIEVILDLSEIANSAPAVGRTYPVSVRERLDESFTRREWNPTAD